jgi:alpha-mannosidase
MNSLDSKLSELKSHKTLGYWAERVISELEYAGKISKLKGNQYNSLIDTALDLLSKKYEEEGSINKAAALEAEAMITELSAEAKKYTVLCAAHAHIDMNWMWRWDETVSVSLDTFRTMLNLMNEYPDFKFSQSQASVYKIVEEYAPDMLEEIKQRVKEGRWEVTASTWVEADKNIPNGESMSRHILYTKRYLAELLNIDPDSLNIDFEPDTFGHSANVPEVLSKGGVKYYYHCRGYNDHIIYRWVAPSGSSIIAYREPLWYLGEMKAEYALYAPEFCEKHNMDTMLKVYGVGDHGGGPTRRDIERIIDMNTWPVFPNFKFGTFKEYYALVEKIAEALPVVKDELNFVFDGCYTTQTRIKMANKISEATLNEAEAFNTAAALCTGFRYSKESFTEAWKNVLFNQFHDIIPGSGTVDTREYAMGLFQKTLAAANTNKKLSLESIASRINTLNLIEELEHIKDTTAEGAGVGFGTSEFKITQTGRGSGRTRVFNFFNSAEFDREEAAEITIWDWSYDLERMTFKDDKGNNTSYQLLDNGFNGYWGHSYIRVLLKVKVPALGYSTYILTQNEDYEKKLSFPNDPRVQKAEEFVLENEYIKAVFDPKNASIKALIDKKTREELVDQSSPAGIFRLIEEDESRGMTAWTVGRYMNIRNLTEDVRISNIGYKSNALRKSIYYTMNFESSSLKVTVSLDYSSTKLDYNIECDWHEIGKPGESIPQLSFYMPVNYSCISYKYDIPFGTIERKAMAIDVPGNSFIVGTREERRKKSLMLLSDSKYGFRCQDNSMSITLIRSSFDPDPYPELGIHKFNFSVALVDNTSNKGLIQYAYAYRHPINVVSANAHGGDLPAVNSFVKLVSGNVAVSSIKMAEENGGNKKIIVRLYETEGLKGEAVMQFFKKPAKAYYVDINEKQVRSDLNINVTEDKVSFEALPYSVETICIEF